MIQSAEICFLDHILQPDNCFSSVNWIFFNKLCCPDPTILLFVGSGQVYFAFWDHISYLNPMFYTDLLCFLDPFAYLLLLQITFCLSAECSAGAQGTIWSKMPEFTHLYTEGILRIL